MTNLSKAIIEQAFTRMGELAQQDGVNLELCVYGGVLMMLAYDVRQNTKDVDAILRPAKEGLSYARKVGQELGLPESWLNSEVKGFLGDKEQLRELLPMEFPGLMLTAPTGGYLLAMKALACRPSIPGHDGDIQDLKFLIGKLGIQSVEEVQATVDQYYSNDVISPRHMKIIENLIVEVGS